MTSDGILSGPLDADGPQRRGPTRRDFFVTNGAVLTHRGSGVTGTVVKFTEGAQVVLRDSAGRDHTLRTTEGLFTHDGDVVSLRAPRRVAAVAPTAPTKSGSVAGDTPARVARASRIYVEGIHDAELIERIWGDDLRYEGVVVEQLEGADDLSMHVRTFGPRAGRRLGILLDHLVEGSKETRIANEINDPNVLIVGHPYVDIWQAIKPQAIGIDAWPDVPMGQPWKEGILEQLNVTIHPAQFWKQVLSSVDSWTDLETPLVTSVEQLIDFVTVEA